MRDISEYHSGVSIYELICHLTDKILDGTLDTFGDLRRYTRNLADSVNTRTAFVTAFSQIRRLNWGLFGILEPETYPKLWDQLVIPDQVYPFAGDLKRNTTISDIYIGLLDIHGYTKFCEENRRNLSMLQLLDEILQNDITEIAAKCGVLSRRSRGDEIILIGTTAEDVLETTLQIASYFSRRRLLKNERIEARRPGYKVILPDMSVSAGIAGGQRFTPLVVTQDGDISGGVVNAAARLQARANKLSPATNKILVTSHVYRRIQTESSISLLIERLGQRIEFFNAGTTAFKGTSIQVFEVLFCEDDYYKVDYLKKMESLYHDIESGHWKGKIFLDMLSVIRGMAHAMPQFTVKTDGVGGKVLTNDSVARWCAAITDRFSVQDDYEGAIAEYSTLSALLSRIPQADPLIIEYASAVCLRYLEILEHYNRELDSFIEGHAESIFSPNERDTFVQVKKYYHMYERFKTFARTKAGRRKLLWHSVIERLGNGLDVTIRAAKE